MLANIFFQKTKTKTPTKISLCTNICHSFKFNNLRESNNLSIRIETVI